MIEDSYGFWWCREGAPLDYLGMILGVPGETDSLRVIHKLSTGKNDSTHGLWITCG